MKLTTKLRTFLQQENASVRLYNQLTNLRPLTIGGPGDLTISQLIDEWPLSRLKKDVFGFGPQAQAELLELLTRHCNCETGRRFADYCASLRPAVQKASPARTKDRTCVYCGCTDSHACDGGCFWIVTFQYGNVGVCSHCIAPHLPLAAALAGITASLVKGNKE